MPLERKLHHMESPGSESSQNNVELIRYRIVVEGTVQGVGFRPFIYGPAHSFLLTGVVSNTGGAVHIEAEGPPSLLEQRPDLRLKPHHQHLLFVMLLSKGLKVMP